MAQHCLKLIILMACIAMSSRAQAAATSEQSPAEQVPVKPRYRSEWYGGYTLAVDAVGIVTMPILVGIGIYALGAPIVHLAEGEPGHAAWSLGLRVGLPTVLGLTGAGIGALAGNRNCDSSSLSGDACDLAPALYAAGGVILGMLGAIAIDAALLARHQVSIGPLERAGIRFAPNLALGRNHASLVMSGTF
jgi:hypothetical protein